MKSMKKVKKEISEVKDVYVDEYPYPYGLEISLDKESLEKLGIETLPPIDTVFLINAQAKVVRATHSSSAGGDQKSMSLQITDMEMTSKDKKKKSKESIMYGE